jgi:hypothetical protein
MIIMEIIEIMENTCRTLTIQNNCKILVKYYLFDIFPFVKRNPFKILPPEMIEYISIFLDDISLLNFCMTNKRIKAINENLLQRKKELKSREFTMTIYCYKLSILFRTSCYRLFL